MKGPYHLPDEIGRDDAYLARCVPLSVGAGALAALIGFLTLAGWLFGIEPLLWAPAGKVVMKANAALCFLLAGISLAILGSGRRPPGLRHLAGTLGFAVALIALITLAEYFTGWNPGIDQLLATENPGAVKTTSPGRMAPNATLAFLMLGSCLLLLAIGAGDWVVSVLGFLSGLVALHGLMGFAYKTEEFQTFINYTHIAFQTALALMALSVGVLMALGDRGMMGPLSRKSAGAIQARLMLPAMAIVPFLLAWIRHEGIHRGLFAGEFGVAIMVVASSAALVVVVWVGLLRIDRSDQARARAFESLKSEQRFRAAIEDSILTGIVASDTRGRITYVNREFCRMVGRSETELAGCGPPYPFTHPDERRSVFRVFSALRKGRISREGHEFRFRRVDGESFAVSTYLSELRDDRGQVIGTLGAVTDVSEKKRQELEIARTTEILERIFSNMHSGIVYLDREFTFLRVNQSYCDAVGHPSEELIGKNHFDLFPGAEREALFHRVVETGEPHAAFAEPFEFPGRPGLGVTYQDWTLQPVKGRDGSVVGLIFWMNDVTQRLRAEANLKEIEQVMVRQGKMAVLGQMAAGIAHEIRNPLSGLNLYLAAAEKLSGEAEFPDPAQRETMVRSFETARAASVKIEGVIRRVMDFVRPAPLRIVPVVINHAVSEALAMAAATARKGGVAISADLSGKLPECRADARLIEQLVLNLVDNALQAVEKQDGEKRVAVSTAAEGACVVLRVGDSGPGVSPEDRERIFDPFFTTKATGTGLGLSICNRIAADHGGVIEVGTSALGGAEFIVRLPSC